MQPVRLPARREATTENRRLSRRTVGECKLSWDQDQLIVERADRYVHLNDQFMSQVAGPKKVNPWVDVMYPSNDFCDPDDCCQVWRNGHCYYGSILTIRGTNATVMYRIGRYLKSGVWEAFRADL